MTGIISLINDIDENICQKTVQTIVERGCTVAVKQCLNSITSFTLSHYTFFNLHGVKLYIANELQDKDYIKNKLDKWLFIIPKEELNGIDRIYIISNNENYKYNGTYMPILSYITLVWKSDFINSFLWRWMDLIKTQHTLYHEIGHHHYKHIFGKDQVQEYEADAYANTLMQNAHPFLKFLVKILKLFGLRKRSK